MRRSPLFDVEQTDRSRRSPRACGGRWDVNEEVDRELDKAKAEAFAGSLLTALNHGGLCLMVSVGHRTGLFDAMSEAPPTTSDELIVSPMTSRTTGSW